MLHYSCTQASVEPSNYSRRGLKINLPLLSPIFYSCLLWINCSLIHFTYTCGNRIIKASPKLGLLSGSIFIPLFGLCFMWVLGCIIAVMWLWQSELVPPLIRLLLGLFPQGLREVHKNWRGRMVWFKSNLCSLVTISACLSGSAHVSVHCVWIHWDTD